VPISVVRGSEFSSHKGVRQGDLLSHFLFNLVVEVLSKMVQQAYIARVIVGLIFTFCHLVLLFSNMLTTYLIHTRHGIDH
jgi:hypothetical protein